MEFFFFFVFFFEIFSQIFFFAESAERCPYTGEGEYTEAPLCAFAPVKITTDIQSNATAVFQLKKKKKMIYCIHRGGLGKGVNTVADWRDTQKGLGFPLL